MAKKIGNICSSKIADGCEMQIGGFNMTCGQISKVTAVEMYMCVTSGVVVKSLSNKERVVVGVCVCSGRSGERADISSSSGHIQVNAV